MKGGENTALCWEFDRQPNSIPSIIRRSSAVMTRMVILWDNFVWERNVCLTMLYRLEIRFFFFTIIIFDSLNCNYFITIILLFLSFFFLLICSSRFYFISRNRLNSELDYQIGIIMIINSFFFLFRSLFFFCFYGIVFKSTRRGKF